MPIDLDGLALIDTLLDTIVELRLMQLVWSKEAEEDLKTIHNSVLRLNELWQLVDDYETVAYSHEIRTPMNAILGFTKMIKTGIDGIIPVEAVPYLDKLESLAGIILQRIFYNYYQGLPRMNK